MTKIKKLADEMKDELHSAKCYAEEYLTYKSKNDTMWANRYKEMAGDELKHANYIHERVVSEIKELQTIYTPPQDMMEKWDADHKKYIEKNRMDKANVSHVNKKSRLIKNDESVFY